MTGVPAADPAGSRRDPAPVRRLGAHDAATAVEVLVRAFDDDPMALYMFGEGQGRKRALRRFFTIQIRHTYLVTGQGWVTDDIGGVALWAPPGRRKAMWRDAWHLAPVLPRLLAGSRRMERMRVLTEVEGRHPTVPHWYLGTLGTDPPRQGRGIGSRLLAAKLRVLDEEGVPAYLESSKERNVPFYARHGFEVTGEIRAPHGGPTLWLMWRDPRPPES